MAPGGQRQRAKARWIGRAIVIIGRPRQNRTDGQNKVFTRSVCLWGKGKINKVAPRPWDVARPGPKLSSHTFPPRPRSFNTRRACVCVFFGGGISLLKNRSPGPTDPSYKWTRVKLISATKSQPIHTGLRPVLGASDPQPPAAAAPPAAGHRIALRKECLLFEKCSPFKSARFFTF